MYLRVSTLRLYANTPPQFHMAQPNGIGKHLGDSRRDPKLDRKAKQYSRSSSIQNKQVSSHRKPIEDHHH
jgi:hypothetical protein